ncbi:hypothetical protein [Peribacillus frigoritolerans]|uniref:hypothetical protein n=1 Tax=Peribacillus frigoritolerans TaxID=450367 RepID=UPI00227FF039|nr:hypothetical protein [Peribacillus frigoritolerans]MCY8936980.1 hypothetical protein [Peribacillus frigoritolerans]
MGSIKIFKKVGLELVIETPAGKGVPTGTKAPGADRPRKASAWREMNVRNSQISNPS